MRYNVKITIITSIIVMLNMGICIKSEGSEETINLGVCGVVVKAS